MIYKWTILEVFAKDEIITGVKYHLIGTDNDISVETEGNWYFEPSEKTIPYADVTESMIIDWIDDSCLKTGENHIKKSIETQIEALKLHKPVPAPWLPQVFKPEI
jgi:hypothetical protein